MKNADMPAMPSDTVDTKEDWEAVTGGGRFLPSNGLTKREHFCLIMGVADTGDDELDEIIRKGNKQKIASEAMSAWIQYYGRREGNFNTATRSLQSAQSLLNRLEEND